MEYVFLMVVIILFIGVFSNYSGGEKSSAKSAGSTSTKPKSKSKNNANKYAKSSPLISMTDEQKNEEYEKLESQINELTDSLFKQNFKDEIELNDLKKLLDLQLEQKFLSSAKIAKINKLDLNRLRIELAESFFKKRNEHNLIENTTSANLIKLITTLTAPILIDLENKYFKPKKK